jgi:gliding motility-associated-like protein
MFPRFLLSSLLLFLIPVHASAQSVRDYSLVVQNGKCELGRAIIKSSGLGSGDSTHIRWSTGHTDIAQISGLEPGEYNVNISVRQKKDTVYVRHDTTIYFTVEKEFCDVQMPRFFTPNGDGHNDLFYISNVHYYPNFELEIFNKWGQRVHHQQGSFEAWDGKWLGIDLPDGVYYYIFLYEAGNKKRIAKGDVTILR